MKTNLLTFLSLLLITPGIAQPWVPQGFDLIPDNYTAKSISVVGESVIWVAVSLDHDNYAQHFPVIILRSDDGGDTWQSHGTSLTVTRCCPEFITIKAIDDNTAWLTISSGNQNTFDINEYQRSMGLLYKTEDEGRSWNLKLSDRAVGRNMLIKDKINLTCQRNEYLAWSEDNGETWQKGMINGKQDGFYPYSRTRGSLAGDTLWIGMAGLFFYIEPDKKPGQAGLIRATDYGRNLQWIDCQLDSVASIVLLSFSDHLHGFMMYSRWQKLYDRYHDYWYSNPPWYHGWYVPLPLYTFDIYNFNYSYYDDYHDQGNRNYLARTEDGGTTWTPLTLSVRTIRDMVSIPGAPGNCAVVSNDEGSPLIWSIDRGKSWSDPHLPYEVCCVDFSGPTTGWAAVNGRSGSDPLVLKWNADVTTKTEDIATLPVMAMMVFPNPTSELIYYQTRDDLREHRVTLTDVTGRVVIQRTTNRQEIDVANLPEGLYFLKVEQAGKTGIARVIKQ